MRVDSFLPSSERRSSRDRSLSVASVNEECGARAAASTEEVDREGFADDEEEEGDANTDVDLMAVDSNGSTFANARASVM